MHNVCRWACALGLVSAAVLGPAAERNRSTTDWPTWRGPNRDAVSTETGLLKRWDDGGPPLAWRADGLGGGYSSVAIADGRIFTLGQRSDGCELIALHVNGGRELWSARVGPGSPNGTPTVDGDLVFAVGRQGDLLCAAADTGREVWRKNYRQDFGGTMMSGWGYSESPLVDGDRLICTPGASDAMLAALDKRTGAVVWKSKLPAEVRKVQGGRSGSNDGAGYSSVVISEAGGVRQYVQLVGHGIVSFAAEDGRFLWAYPRIANTTANIPTPIVAGDYVFCSTGYGDGGTALLRVVRSGRRLKAEEVYYRAANVLQNHHGGMILVGDHVYFGHGHNNGFPVCVELETGKVAWGGQIRGADGQGSGSAAIVYADGHLYFRYQNGVMALVEANPEAYVLKGTFRLATTHAESWPHPVIHKGKLYLRDQQTLLCYDVRDE